MRAALEAEQFLPLPKKSITHTIGADFGIRISAYLGGENDEELQEVEMAAKEEGMVDLTGRGNIGRYIRAIADRGALTDANKGTLAGELEIPSGEENTLFWSHLPGPPLERNALAERAPGPIKASYQFAEHNRPLSLILNVTTSGEIRGAHVPIPNDPELNVTFGVPEKPAHITSSIVDEGAIVIDPDMQIFRYGEPVTLSEAQQQMLKNGGKLEYVIDLKGAVRLGKDAVSLMSGEIAHVGGELKFNKEKDCYYITNSAYSRHESKGLTRFENILPFFNHSQLKTESHWIRSTNDGFENRAPFISDPLKSSFLPELKKEAKAEISAVISEKPLEKHISKTAVAAAYQAMEREQHRFTQTVTFSDAQNLRRVSSKTKTCSVVDLEAFRSTWLSIAEKVSYEALRQPSPRSVYIDDLERALSIQADSAGHNSDSIQTPIDTPAMEAMVAYLKLVGVAMIALCQIGLNGSDEVSQDPFGKQLVDTLTDRLTIAYGRPLSPDELNAKLKLAGKVLNDALYVEQDDLCCLITDEPYSQLARQPKIISPQELESDVPGIQLDVHRFELGEENKRFLINKYVPLDQPSWITGYQFIRTTLGDEVSEFTPIRPLQDGSWLVELSADDAIGGPTLITMLTDRHLAGRSPTTNEKMVGFITGQPPAISTALSSPIVLPSNPAAYRTAFDRSGLKGEKQEYLRYLGTFSSDIATPDCVKTFAERAARKIESMKPDSADAAQRMEDTFKRFKETREDVLEFLGDAAIEPMQSDVYPRLVRVMHEDFAFKLDRLISTYWDDPKKFNQEYRQASEQFQSKRFELLTEQTKENALKRLNAFESENNVVPDRSKTLAKEAADEISQVNVAADNAVEREAAVEQIENILGEFEDKREFLEEMHENLNKWNDGSEFSQFTALNNVINRNFIAEIDSLMSKCWHLPDRFFEGLENAKETFNTERLAAVESCIDLQIAIRNIAPLNTASPPFSDGSPAHTLLSKTLPKMLQALPGLVRDKAMITAIVAQLSAIETCITNLHMGNEASRLNDITTIKQNTSAIGKTIGFSIENENDRGKHSPSRRRC